MAVKKFGKNFNQSKQVHTDLQDGFHKHGKISSKQSKSLSSKTLTTPIKTPS